MATRISDYNRIVANNDERRNTEVVSCMDCKWAHLLQYGSNPVLAECMRRPNRYNARFPYEVMVASARWICPTWKRDSQVKSIEKREKAA